MTALSEEQATGRTLRCRYLKKLGVRCDNEIAGLPDDDVLLCPKHLFEAWRQFQQSVTPDELRLIQRATSGTRTQA